MWSTTYASKDISIFSNTHIKPMEKWTDGQQYGWIEEIAFNNEKSAKNGRECTTN